MPDHTAMVIFSSSLFGSFIHVHTRVKLVLFVEQILFEWIVRCVYTDPFLHT